MISETIIDTLPDLFFSLNHQGEIQHLSAYSKTLLGIDAVSLRGQSLAVLCATPDDIGDFLNRFASTSQDQAVQVELELQHQMGHSVWVSIHACAHYEGQTLTSIDGIARDISPQKETRKALEQSQDRFKRLSDVSTEAIFIHSQGRILDCNRAAEQMFGFDHEEFTEMYAWDVIDPQDIPLSKKMVSSQYEKPYEVHGLRKDGSIFPMEIYSKQSWMGDLSVRVTSIHDLTERKSAEVKLNQLSHAVMQSPVAIGILNAEGKIEYANPATSEMTGYMEADLVGSHMPSYCNVCSAAESCQVSSAIKTVKAWSGEVYSQRKNGEHYWKQVSITPIATAERDEQHFLLMMEDISLRKQQEEKIKRQASYDSLTSLPNRLQAQYYLDEYINHSELQNSQCALLFVDLDEFKAVNDSLGHEYGDALLQQAALRLSECVSENDQVARFGGDEFLVMRKGVHQASEVQELAESLVERFCEPFNVRGRDLITTASIGIALYPIDGADGYELLRNADTAMYQAKGKGKNGYCFFDLEMNIQAQRRLQIEGYLRKALENNELTLHYQPVFDLKKNEVVGAEALIRWNSPELGFMFPAEFIPMAESTGLIVPIGEWVLQQACEQAAKWSVMSKGAFRIAVNVSPRQFQGDKLLYQIKNALTVSGLEYGALEVEVTEGLLLKSRASTTELLKQLRVMGVRIAIDDFGTGYSSLSYLEKMPFTTLKIDRSFIDGMLDSAHRYTLVKTIISMAQGLGLAVVAEGVEEAGQQQRLSELGCDFEQGFYISKPLPADEFQAVFMK